MSESTLLQIENLVCRGFSKTGDIILELTSQRFHERSWYRIAGDSGSGKTVLLKTIAGMNPFEGTIRLRNVALQSTVLSEWRKRILFLPSNPIPLANTVGEAIQLPFVWRGIVPPDTTSIEECLQKFSLTCLCDTSTANLSTGEKMRLSLARAFLLRPELLLLDESLAPLDTGNRLLAITAFQELTDMHGTTIIWVDHNHPELTISPENTIDLQSGTARIVV
ncbi:MAG: ATP-binding cassette domain-containing protein [bacterium]|nr:ATP-binding cassette domain-containing protein [bacterium]